MASNQNGHRAQSLEMAPLPGSWEEQLRKAQQLAANRDLEAITIYRKLLDRLSKMSRQQRMAHDGRLQAVFEQAAVNAQSFFNVLERYDEALDVIQTLREGLEPSERREIDLHTSDIQWMAGRVDEAAATLRAIAEGSDAEDDNDGAADEGGDLLDLGAIAYLYIRSQRIDDAQKVLAEMERWMHGRYGDEPENAEASDRDLAYIDNMRSILATEQGEWAEGITHFRAAMAGDPYFASSPQLLYTRLIRGQRFAEALEFIDMDTNRQIRPAFWRGLALWHLGKEKAARAQWTTAIETEITQEEGDSFSDVILSFYYMGDEERLGQELALRVLQEVRNPNWSSFFLVALGWALHGNEEYALANMDIALQQRRASAEGTKLASDVQLFIEDLVPDELRAQMLGFVGE